MTASTPFPRSLALYLTAVQCLATASWIAYVVYLPRLATSAGLPASAVGWILIADQVLFALADLALGQAADRALRVMRTLGPWLVAITVVSGAAFVAVPLFSGTVAPPLFLALIFFWAAASSVLRAPALALVAKRTPTPALPWLGTLVVIGTALAAAAAPYLALMAKSVDPLWPFLAATGTLVAAVVGLAWAERRGAPAADALAAERPAVSGARQSPDPIDSRLCGDLSLAADGVLGRRRAAALARWHRGARRLMPGNEVAAYNPVTCRSNPGHA